MSFDSLDVTQPRGWCRTHFTASPEKQIGQAQLYRFDLKPRVLTVLQTQRISATMVRIRCSCDDQFDGFHTLGPEDHVKLFFDRDENGAPRMPSLRFGRWNAQGFTFRDYTVRWLNVEEQWIDLDFVIHDHGVAGTWAASAKPGDQLGMLGPRGSVVIPDVFDWYLLAGDETALPAIARWLEGLRDGVPVTAYLEVDSAASEIPLPTKADLTVRWCHRNGAPAGTTTVLADAVTAHEFPDHRGLVWASGEATGLKPIRQYIKDSGFPTDQVKIDGYWKLGTVNLDHHAPQE